ncbi:hypothetical protein PoB_004115500 [Plakobranchus ocellatus]|uniref:Uncharacterized protein n=1 Tax=Plakobranchus ocellatus TaxID=259542 RepID=A0AAV4B227_9GAST|nr:hypothetical protein PoB_004115500 [Plakobranchus ocellatus]
MLSARSWSGRGGALRTKAKERVVGPGNVHTDLYDPTLQDISVSPQSEAATNGILLHSEISRDNFKDKASTQIVHFNAFHCITGGREFPNALASLGTFQLKAVGNALADAA